MSIVKSGIIVSFYTLISRISGFIRDILISMLLGAGLLTDLFNIAFRIPNFFRRIFAEGAFNSAFLPILSSKLATNDKEEVKYFLNNSFTILLIAVIILVITFELFMPNIIKILVPGYSTNDLKFKTAILLTRITMPYLLFISLVSFLSGILNSINKFAIAAAIPILLNLVLILALICLPKFTPTAAHALSVGVVIAGVIQLFIVAIVVYKVKLLPVLTKPNFTKDIKKLLKNMIPGIISSGIVQINLAVDLAIVTFLPVGSLSYLTYAERISYLPLAIIGTAMGTVLLPTLSRYIKQKKLDKVNNIQNKSIEIACILSLPCSFGMIILAEMISYIIYQRGVFTAIDTYNVKNALMAFAIGIPAFILIKVFTTTFFATQDTKTPLKVSAFCIFLNIILSLILMNYLQHSGIALASSIASWANCLLLLFILRKRNMINLKLNLLYKIIKVLIICGMMSIFLMIFKPLAAKFIYHSHFIIKISVFMSFIISAILLFFTLCNYLKVLTYKEAKGWYN